MKVGLIVWTFICLKSTTGQEWMTDNEGYESRVPPSYEQSSGDMVHSGSKPEAYFLHFKPHASDYYRKQPSKFLLLLRLPEEDRAESAQKIAQVIEDSQAPFSGVQQQKADDAGFDDDSQQRIKSVSQSKQEEAPIEQHRAAPWVPSDSSKFYGSSAAAGTKSPGDSPVQQSAYGSPLSAAKSSVGGYKSSLSQAVKTKSAVVGYGAAKASGGGYGGGKGAPDVQKPDFGTKSGVSAGGAGGYGSGASSASAGGYGASAAADFGGYGASAADDGFDSSSAVGGGGYGSAGASGYGASGAAGASGGYAQKGFKSSAVDSAVKGGPSVRKAPIGGDYGAGAGAPKSPIDYMQRTLAKAVQAAIKGGVSKSSSGDYGQKETVGAQISSPVMTVISSLGLGFSADYSPKGVYFANKEAVIGSPQCKCDAQDSQSMVGIEGYQRAESQPGAVNVASISDGETKEDISGYSDEAAVSDEGKIPVIFIGLPKQKYA